MAEVVQIASRHPTARIGTFDLRDDLRDRLSHSRLYLARRDPPVGRDKSSLSSHRRTVPY
jgi:hypothetical protein